jgi:hypothetical protein
MMRIAHVGTRKSRRTSVAHRHRVEHVTRVRLTRRDKPHRLAPSWHALSICCNRLEGAGSFGALARGTNNEYGAWRATTCVCVFACACVCLCSRVGA